MLQILVNARDHERARAAPIVAGLIALVSIAFAAVALAGPVAGNSAITFWRETLPPGWAPGGTPSDPASQIKADTSCGTNSVLLFSARGSGDAFGGDLAHDKIGAWTQGAGIQLIHAGWNVRDLQAIYSAPPVPLKQLALALTRGGLSAKSAAVATLIVKQYRDAASNSWRSVKAELEAAYARCPNRKIMLAGYSQGAILLRYIVPQLDPTILAQIVSVDLIADPTEQRVVDRLLKHPRDLDGRLTDEGIDTFAGTVLHALHGGLFRQKNYPTSIAERTYQYCVDGDLVCDFKIQNLAPSLIFNEGRIHASYGFELIGLAAGRRLGRLSSPRSRTCSLPNGTEGGGALPFTAIGISCARAGVVISSFVHDARPCLVSTQGCKVAEGFVCRAPGGQYVSPGERIECSSGAREIRFSLPG